jgi:hypothetical protein
MTSSSVPLDVTAAQDHLMRLLSVEGVTGQEAKIAATVSDALKEVGVPASAIRFDDANTRIPVPTETGNLIVELAGTRPGPRLPRAISIPFRSAPAPSPVVRATASSPMARLHSAGMLAQAAPSSWFLRRP